MRHWFCLHSCSKGCFNPRICKRCDVSDTNYRVGFSFVSIHASVKDATTSGFIDFSKTAVSIHASVKDATLVQLWVLLLPWSFNPRICKRCDSEVYSACALVNCFNPRICKRCDRVGVAVCLPFSVSIHASVKDATITADVSF